MVSWAEEINCRNELTVTSEKGSMKKCNHIWVRGYFGQ